MACTQELTPGVPLGGMQSQSERWLQGRSQECPLAGPAREHMEAGPRPVSGWEALAELVSDLARVPPGSFQPWS